MFSVLLKHGNGWKNLTRYVKDIEYSRSAFYGYNDCSIDFSIYAHNELQNLQNDSIVVVVNNGLVVYKGFVNSVKILPNKISLNSIGLFRKELQNTYNDYSKDYFNIYYYSGDGSIIKIINDNVHGLCAKILNPEKFQVFSFGLYLKKVGELGGNLRFFVSKDLVTFDYFYDVDVNVLPNDFQLFEVNALGHTLYLDGSDFYIGFEADSTLLQHLSSTNKIEVKTTNVTGQGKRCHFRFGEQQFRYYFIIR